MFSIWRTLLNIAFIVVQRANTFTFQRVICSSLYRKNVIHPKIAFTETSHKYTKVVSDLTLALLLEVQSPRSPHDSVRGDEDSSAAIPPPRKSTPVRAEEASSQVWGSDGRAVLALVTRLKKKLRASRGVAGWWPGHPGPTHGDVPSFGVSYRRPELIPPLKLGPHPQSCAVSTHRPMKAPGACKLAAPAPAFEAEPLRPNTTWHASELHVHSRSCKSSVRARERALARKLARDQSGGIFAVWE